MILALLLHLFAAQVAPTTFTFPIPIPTGCTAVVSGSNIMVTCPVPAPPPPPPPALTITTPITLPGAFTDKAYSVDLSKLANPTGGVPPYTFQAISGFPSWLSLSSSGLLTGTPTSTGFFTLSFSVTDSSGVSKVIEMNLIGYVPPIAAD